MLILEKKKRNINNVSNLSPENTTTLIYSSRGKGVITTGVEITETKQGNNSI